MTFRTKFLLFVSICVPPNNPITACGATSFPGYHSFPKWAIYDLYLPYLKFARGFQAASAQAQFYAQRSRIHLSALWRRWSCSTNKTKTSPVLCSSAASKHTQRTHVHVYVRGSYWLLFISIPVPLRSFVEASQNPPAKLYLKPKGVYPWNFFYEENLCSY